VPPRPSRTRDQIVATALDVVERNGLERFSMRKLADALDAGTMSVYAYFADKEDLLDAMVATVLGEIELAEGPTGRDVLTAWAGETRRALLGHQGLVPLVMSPDRRHLLDHLAGEVQLKVRRLGLSDAAAGRHVAVVGRYLIGAVILDTASSPSAPGQRNAADRNFRVGLEAVLDGIAAGGSDGL